MSNKNVCGLRIHYGESPPREFSLIAGDYIYFRVKDDEEYLAAASTLENIDRQQWVLQVGKVDQTSTLIHSNALSSHMAEDVSLALNQPIKFPLRNAECVVELTEVIVRDN